MTHDSVRCHISCLSFTMAKSPVLFMSSWTTAPFQYKVTMLYACVTIFFVLSNTGSTLGFTLPLKSPHRQSIPTKLQNIIGGTDSSPNVIPKDARKESKNNRGGTNLDDSPPDQKVPPSQTPIISSYFQEQRDIIKSKLSRCLKSLDEKRKKNEDYTQSYLDYALALAIASGDDDSITKIQHEMKKCGFPLQLSTYRSILKECLNAGNGRASYKALQDMRGDNIQISEQDIHQAVGAICKSNRFDPGIWREGLDLIQNYVAHKRDDTGALKVETYNAVIICMTKDGCWSDVWDVLHMMENQPEDLMIHPQPTLSTYHIILEGLFHSKDGPQSAQQLLLSMNSKGVNPSLYTFDLALSIFLKRDNNCWKMALDMIEMMHQKNFNPTLVMYNRVISTCAQAQQLGHATSLLLKMKNRKINADIVTYNSIISACASSGRWRDALRYLQEINQGRNIQPDIITYTLVIRACAKGKKPDKALELFQDAKKKGLPLDTYVYASVIDACAKGNLWRKSLEILDDMKSVGIPPNGFTYSAAISACGNCGEWQTAISLLDQMREEGIQPNLIAYNSAISALAKASRVNMHKAMKYHYIQSGTSAITLGIDEQQLWKRSLLLFDSMKSDGIVPDAWTYSGVISTLGYCEKVQDALILFEEMRLVNKANKVSYTAAIDACRGQWESAHRLFLQMQEDNIDYDVVTYNSLLSAYMAGEQADMAYNAWKLMMNAKSDSRSKVKLDIISLTIVLATLERCSTRDYIHEIDDVFADAVEHQIILPKESIDTTWEIDLSGMSFPVARAACRFILRRIKAMIIQGDKCQDLLFITGLGKRNVSIDQTESDQLIGESTGNSPLLILTRDGTLREYIRQVLRDDFKPPLYSTVPTLGDGMVQVTSDVLRIWIDSN